MTNGNGDDSIPPSAIQAQPTTSNSRKVAQYVASYAPSVRDWRSIGRAKSIRVDGGFFLTFHHKEFGRGVNGVMLIGYKQWWGEKKPINELIENWLESRSRNHFVYVWEVTDNTLTFWFEKRGSGATFCGRFSDDVTTMKQEAHY
jgi:hypothetical protein